MNSFDNVFDLYLKEMARSSDMVDFGGAPDDLPSKAVPNRGAANRFGKYQNSDVQPFFQAVVQDFLSRENKKITYAEVAVAIKNILVKGKDRGGMGMAGTFADKWTQHLSDVLFKLLKSVNTAFKSPKSEPDDVPEDKTPIDVAPESPQASDEEDSGSSEDETSGSEEEIPSTDEAESEEEVSPEEPAQDNSDLEDTTAGLNLNPEEEALLDVISSLGTGGKEVTNKEIINDPATPFKLRDDPTKLREVLGKMARVHKVISRGDVGWIVKETEPAGDSDSVYDREEDGTDYGAIDTINKYASDYGDGGRSNPFLDQVDLRQVFVDTFKSISVIRD
jgi:hypothetical protein